MAEPTDPAPAPRTVTYAETGPARGQLLDVHTPPTTAPCRAGVLLWHGIGPDERRVLAPLARATAALGVTVFVPDWRPDGPDGGRSHLLASLAFVRDHAAGFGVSSDRIVLAGWSAGAGAAAGVALRPGVLPRWHPHAVVAVAGDYTRLARTTGAAPLEEPAVPGLPQVPVTLVHGAHDTQVDSRHSRRLQAALQRRNWPVRLTEPVTDHAGVIMCAYDPAAGRCVPATDAHALRAGAATARLLAGAATGGPPEHPADGSTDRPR
ncbi:alpha/beta hydrolase [Streptomyces sp. NPDC006283]|uniref:alpha/beta hydrolase n=1 Tax=Streptomyces sp. NPDC006283 TaxID=3156741 RepID=UPI0033ACB074